MKQSTWKNSAKDFIVLLAPSVVYMAIALLFLQQPRAIEISKSILLLSICIGLFLIFLVWNINRLGERLNNPLWVKNNMWQRDLGVWFPQGIIVSPIREEILFRTPLLFLFTGMTTYAWLGVGLTSLGFGLLHLKNKGQLISINEVLNHHTEKGGGTVEELIKEIQQENKETGHDRRQMWVQVMFSSVMGIAYGVAVIQYQSLYAGVLMHAMWNLIGPSILTVLLISCCLIWNNLFFKINQLRHRHKPKRRLFNPKR